MKTPVIAWKKRVKLKTIQIALNYLNSNIERKSREYSELKMSPYLCPNDELPVTIAKFIAKTQSHMIENMKINDLKLKHSSSPISSKYLDIDLILLS